MCNLQAQPRIHRESLEESHYFRSLLQAATKAGLLSEAELLSLQHQSLQLLAEQIRRYTSGESSSVPVETAQQLLDSIFYCAGLTLKRCPTPDAAVGLLKRAELYDLQQSGLLLATTKRNTARGLLKTIQNTRLQTPNIAYNDTLMKGLGPFFTHYDPAYAAMEIPGSIDYPLSNDSMDTAGVEYILQYLNMLYLENRFCTYFDAATIHRILRGYDSHYEDLLVNLYEQVLLNALGRTLLGQSPMALSVESNGQHQLQQELAPCSLEALSIRLQSALSGLCKTLCIQNPALCAYLACTLQKITPRIHHALQTQTLFGIFVTALPAAESSAFSYQDGTPMEDEAFRRLLDEVRDCRFVQDKVRIIRDCLHSLTDVIDLMESACLFGEEYALLFDAMEDIELALLYCRLPSPLDDTALHVTAAQDAWQQALLAYLEQLDPARGADIRSIASQIAP